MPFEKEAEKAVKIIDEQIASLKDVFNRVRGDGDFDAAYERMKRWKERTSRLIGEHIHPNEGEKLKKKSKGSFIITLYV